MPIIKWLAARRWAQIGLALILAAVLFAALDRCAKHLVDGVQDSAAEAGRQQERSDSLQISVTRTKEADNAAETVRRDPDARRANCLRDARNPEDC